MPPPFRTPLRLLTAAGLVLCLSFAPARARAASPVTLANWDQAQQQTVIRAGLMGNVGSSFGGAAQLSAAQANAITAALASRLHNGVTAVTTTQSPVSLTTYDRMLVQQLGLSAVAGHVQQAAVSVGLRPPRYFGSELVARFLGLRYNHPSGTDQLELFPYDPVTRAEAAWSLAEILSFGDWNISYAQQTLSTFQLPVMTANQLAALQIAVSRIGYPYVYAGESDTAEPADWMWGPQAHGGFDCSGFVWRVFKVSGLPWGRAIGGRTAAQMAGEIPRRQRLRYRQLQPGDLLFFGSAHFRDRASEANIIHAGIYLGDNWVIHSSDQGVYVLPLNGSWLGDQFAWGRRVIH